MRDLFVQTFTAAIPLFSKSFSGRRQREAIVSPRLELPVHYDLHFEYKMSHENRGVALIFNHEIFLNNRCARRYGTTLDRDKLKKVLESFNFEVKVFNDLSVDGIIHELNRGMFKKPFKFYQLLTMILI